MELGLGLGLEREGKGREPGDGDGIADARLWITSRETPGKKVT
jgi:hypothetical protein